MKKEFGKWFLDLAKYILTAMFLTSVFTDMEKSEIQIYTLLAFLFCVSFGYLLLRNSGEEEKANENNRNSKNRKKKR